MARSIVAFASLLLAALVVGTMFGIWLGYSPSDLSAGAYIEQQQHAIRALNVTMPLLGALTALLTLVSAVQARGNPRQALFLFAAFGCFVTAGLITRLLNQPINAILMTWTAATPPTNWTELRDAWWRWHSLRTAFGVVGLSLLIGANLVGSAAVLPTRAQAKSSQH